MRRLTLAILLMVATTALLGSSAVAAGPGTNGATVINIDTCAPLIGSGTVCITAKGVINETQTPSGKKNYTTNYREEINVLNDAGEVVTTFTSKEHFHALTMDGALHTMSERSRFTVTNFGQTFCVQYHLQYANGEDQFFRVVYC
jgi:hypothetical protein